MKDIVNMKKANFIVYTVLALLFGAAALLVFLSQGDRELRRALEENREFLVRVDGEDIAAVSLQDLVELGPQEFTTNFATSIASPRKATLRGVELRKLLEALEIEIDHASHFVVSGLDSYYSPLTLAEVLRDEHIYVCFEMDGEILKTQSEGGYGPFLTVLRDSRFAQRWCKYVEAIDVINA